jgi:anaerobic magnesium-protoporphyrin IX monomethyl ester cyclase
MTRVVLINPPQPSSLDDRLDPPLGLMYIGASLKSKSIDTRIVDLSNVSRNQWEEKIGHADVYGTTVFTPSFYICKEINKISKENNPDAILVAGGPHSTALPHHTIKDGGFDYVIRGPGEYEFPILIKSLDNGISQQQIITANPIADLDNLQFPDRSLVDLKTYNRRVNGQHATTMLSSRGCPFTCNFCCKDVHGKKISFRSVPNFIEEVNGVILENGINNFLFYDDIFTFNKGGRLEELTKELKKLGVTYRCNGRAGINNYEEFKMLADSGCEEIAFGIESGSESQLIRMGKGTSLEKNYQAIKDAKKAGITTKAYLIAGFPGETEETIKETIKFMKEADPDKFTVFGFVPLPGSDTWKNPKKYGIEKISEDWEQYFNISGQYEGGLTFETKEMDRAELKRLHDMLVRSLLERGQRGPMENYYSKLSIIKK